MSVVVRLTQIIEALEYPEDWECFLDRSTGQIITVTDNEAPYLESDEDDFDELPEWHRTSIAEVRRALESADLVPLPSKFDVHEWEIMRRFSSSRGEPDRSELLDALRGSGAFRLFRRTIDDLDLREAWFEYRSEALKRIATEWLKENHIEFAEE